MSFGTRAAQAFEDVVEADGGDGEGEADADGEVDVDVVGEGGVDGVHAGLPGGELTGGVEDGVGDPGEDHAEKGADDGIEGKDHSDEEVADIEGEGDGRCGEDVLGGGGEIGEGDGEELDGVFEEDGGEGGDADVECAEDESDHAADGEDAPTPASFCGGTVGGGGRSGGVGGGFGEGGDAEGTDGGHGEGEFFDVGGDAEEDVAEAEVVEAAEELAEDDHADGCEPVPAEEGALGDDVRAGGDPAWDVLGDSLADGRVGGGVILRPEQPGEGRGDGGAGHVEEDENFGPLEGGKGTAGEFDEEDDGDPARRAGKIGAGEQGEIHRRGHHHEADEDAADDGAHGEAVGKSRRRFKKETILAKLAIFFHDALNYKHEATKRRRTTKRKYNSFYPSWSFISSLRRVQVVENMASERVR